MTGKSPVFDSNIVYEQYLFPKLDNEKIEDDASKINRFEIDFERLQENKYFSKDILKNSHQKIENQLSEKDEWYNKGYQKGFGDGVSSEKIKIGTTLDLLKNTLAELENLKTKTVQDYEKQIVRLSIAIAEKLIEKEVSIDKTIIHKLLGNILNKMEDKENIKVRINPADFEILNEINDDLKDLKGLKFIIDTSITEGGCLVESESGLIDARIENRLKMIEDAFNALNVENNRKSDA
jgi:flagellar biosynthesis/type III secretory pathway protein FliH